MKKTTVILFLALMLLTVDSSAQPEIHSINKEASFTGEWIQKILKDPNGDLWFGDFTGNGILKFDGDVWTNYSSLSELPDKVTALAEDQQGNLWIGGLEGAYRFDKVSAVAKFDTLDGLPENHIQDILVDHNGDIWFGTFSGLTKYDGTTWVTYTTSDGLVSNYVNTLFEDNMNRLWIGTYAGISKIQGTFVNYTTIQGLPDVEVHSITQSHDGKIWFGTANGAVSYNDTAFIVYTTADGLSNNNISDILADSKGNLWFTSYFPNGGITKYDGLTWPTFTTVHGLISNYTACAEEDDEGNIWIGTGAGISELKPESWQYITILDGLPNMRVFDILGADDGTKWFATYGGLSHMNDTIFNFTTTGGMPDNRCYAVKQDATGNIWTATLGGAVEILDDTLLVYNVDSGLINNNVYDIEISDDTYWFMTEGGVTRWSGGQWTSYTTANGLAANNSFCGLVDKSGKLWVGSLGNGVSRFDGTLWAQFNTGNGFINDMVWDIFEDTDGNIWFGTEGGVTKFNGSTWENLTKADGLPTNTVRAIGQDGYGNMWFGSDSSRMAVYDGSSFTVYSAATVVPDVRTWEIKEINDTMWAGSDLGIVSYSYKTAWTNYHKSSMPSDTIQTILTDENDNLWLGTWGRGLARFDGKNWYNLDQSGGLSGNNVYDLAEDPEGNIWVATSSGGITKISDTAIKTYSNLDGLTGSGWYSIAVDQDTNIWIGSNAGLNKYDGSAFSSFTQTNGLPGDHVTAILPAKNGDLWIGTVTGNGAARYDGLTWEIYGTSEGLINNNVNDILEDSKGNIWFATYGGVSKFDGNDWTGYASGTFFGNALIWSLLEDKMGNIWACSWGKGAYVFNGKHWNRLQQSDGLASNDIWDAALQSDGTVWLATYGAGISSVFRSAIELDSVAVSPVICHNDSDGVIKIYAKPAGEVSYSIVLNSFSSSGIFTDLPAGSYYPAITNEFDTLFSEMVLFENPAALSLDLGKDTTICSGDQVTLSAPLSWWYEWSNGVSGDRQIIVSEAGVYSVIASDQNGCEGFDTITVEVQNLPVVNLGNDTTICAGGRLLLTAPPDLAYDWSEGSASQQIAVNEAGTYGITVTDEYGCTGSDNIMVNVQDLPDVNLGEDRTLGSLENITLDAGTGFVTYLWSTGATSHDLSVSGASVVHDTMFWVKVTDGYGCSGSDTVMIFDLIENGITEQQTDNSVLIYPNPSGSRIMFKCEDGLKAEKIDLFDESGKLVRSFTVNDELAGYEISLTDIPAGKYFLNIRLNDKNISKVLIKE